MVCKCGSRSTSRDNVTGSLYCSNCYTILDSDIFDPQLGGLNGPTGTYVPIGYAGTGSYSYKDKKIFQAKSLIHEYTFRLNITHKESEITSMISQITEGEFGLGDWFDVLIGACCYIFMRRDNRFLPAAEVADAIGRDVYELGRMIARVVKFLNLSLPELSIAGLFERELNNILMRLENVEWEKKERMMKQGIFLVNCAVKWFLSTGRRPLPLVAAVMALVAELNGVEGFKIEDIAKDLHAVVATCKLRYKELLEALVKVAQVLPWGKDVTVKNVVKYAPFVIRYMEMKSMEEPGEGERVESIDLDDVVSECLRKVEVYGNTEDEIEGDSQYFEGQGDRSGFPRLLNDNDIDNLKLSHESLSLIYTKFSDEVDEDRLKGQAQVGKVGRRKSRGIELLDYQDWWSGKSELSKKLLLKQILEKEIGLDMMPPSFIAGCVAKERRRERINAAKVRIKKIMYPSSTGSEGSDNHCSSEVVRDGKKRKRRKVCEIDWEDFVIETLLLHGVKEEDIEKGHYKALLGLHVFNSGVN